VESLGDDLVPVEWVLFLNFAFYFLIFDFLMVQGAVYEIQQN